MFYLEYLSSTLVALQLQGFENPGIFAVEYTEGNSSTLVEQLRRVALGWAYVVDQCSGMTSNLAVSGDSTGAGLLLSLMLHSVKPCPGVPKIKVKPRAALLSSPWAEEDAPAVPNKSDYLTRHVLEKYRKRLAGPNVRSVEPFDNPVQCTVATWWQAALPPLGTYITYGTEETMSKEIEQLGRRLSSLGQVRVEAEPSQIHSWPLIMHYIGRDEITRHAGIDKLAVALARFLPWART